MTLNNKNVKEAVATAAATSPLWGPKALGLAMTGVGALGTYLQSRKKKEKKSDSSLLDAVRKKQAEIQQDVANQETLNQNKDFEKKEKERGKYVRRKQKPENEFYGEGASIALNVGSKIPWGKVITGLAGAYGTMYQSKKWDELEHTKRGKPINLNPAPSDNPDTIRMRKKRAKEKEEKELKRKEANKEKLKKTIEDLYGPIPEHVNWMKEIIEDAPPGAKYERMVKHIKKSYKKDGKLTDEEKSIAYATAWKNYNNKKAK